MAIDADNNLWTARYDPAKYFYVDGDTGAILRSVNIESHFDTHGPYGAVIDGNGILWISGQGTNKLVRLDPSDDSTSDLPLGHFSYGLGLDDNNHLFVSGWTHSKLSRIDVSTGTKEWTKSGPYEARGVACTSDGDVWVASTSGDKVYRYDNDGIYKADISVGDGPTGVAIDSNGKVWSCNLNDPDVKRTNPATNSVDLSKSVAGSTGHYSYSDMTGIIARTVTTKIGTWTVVFDSGEADMPWGTVSWSSSEPDGTSVTVKVRSSNDQATWSAWETVTNGVALSSTPDGGYLQIETTLQILSGDVSPILYDLTVEVGNQPPNVTDAYPSIDCLWPPNNKFVDLTIEGITDPDGDSVTITVTNITSDEPTASIEGAGGAKHAPDADPGCIGTAIARVRAERSGNEDGRVYEITFVASDGIGEPVEGTVQVKVPHDQSGDCVSIDSGQNYDATEVN